MHKIRLFIFIFVFGILPDYILQAQEIPVRSKHQPVYDFLDELANDNIIDINSAVKPYYRNFIWQKLIEAREQSYLLNKRQLKDLEFYLNGYCLENDSLYNSFTKNKKGNIYTKHNNLNIGYLPPGIFYKDSLVTFSLKPIWGGRYYINKKDDIHYTWGGLESYFTIGKHWGFYANLTEHNMVEPLALPTHKVQTEGGNYKINQEGINATTYSEMRGGVSFSWNRGSIHLVKDHLQWGNNYNGSIIFSGRTPSFGMIKFRLKPLDWFEINYFHASLISEVTDSSKSYHTANGEYRAIYHDKYIAANFYTFKPFKYFCFSVGNSIIYDSDIELVYFIPFLFYKSVDHTESHGIDNQNSQMFGDFSFRMINHLHLYGSIFIDDFSYKRITDKDRQNFIGRKIGGRLSNWPLKNIILTLEYTNTNPVLYKHRVETITFESNNYNLGHYLKDNSQEFFTELQVKPVRGLNIKLSYLYAEHGNEYQYTNGHEAELYPFIEDVTWKNETVSITALYEFISEVYFYTNLNLSNIRSYDVDGITAREYLDDYTPAFYQGKTSTFSFGFNIGF